MVARRHHATHAHMSEWVGRILQDDVHNFLEDASVLHLARRRDATYLMSHLVPDLGRGASADNQEARPSIVLWIYVGRACRAT